jgi:Holliday junction resolvase-like predicted endonuclease
MKNKNSNLAYRTVISIKRFLERNGYEILESAKEMNPCQIIALTEDKNTIVFVHTDWLLACEDFSTVETPNRCEFERQAIKWLRSNNEYMDIAVRFDCVTCNILTADKALIRHQINVLLKD